VEKRSLVRRRPNGLGTPRPAVTPEGVMMTLKFNVKGNINIKRRIIVNGREYASVEEMPADIRHAYEQAMAGAAAEGQGNTPTGPRTRVIFNGREYASLDEMPEEIRTLYNAAMATIDAHGSVEFGVGKAHASAPLPLGPGGGVAAQQPSMAPIEVGGGTVNSMLRVVVAAIVILMLLGALYYLSHVAR
jgi:hypothetical protein